MQEGGRDQKSDGVKISYKKGYYNSIFPNGMSKKGNIDDFDLDLLDFCENIVPEGLSVNDILTQTKIKELRLYLKTTKKVQVDGLTDVEETVADYYINFPAAELEDDPLLEFPLLESQDNTMYENILEPEERPLPQLETFQPAIDLINLSNVENNEPLPLLNTIEDVPILTLHRGNVFRELLEFYKNIQPSLNCTLEIRMLSTHGDVEMDVDLGGIFRDALTEYWTTFYNANTMGTDYKVPYIRHDFGKEDWEAIALIIAHGWKTEKYFPIKIAPVFFFEYCIFENVNSDLTENFIKFVSSCDGAVLKMALEDFDSTDKEELLDVVSLYDSKWKPKRDNIGKLINDIAHKELIQKPTFIVNCWTHHLKGLLSSQELYSIYDIGDPSSKNIIQNLIPGDFKSSSADNVFNFLKKFIKEATLEVREAFLRFCTGSNMVRGNINITFNERKGWERRPVAHTCSSTLEISTQYDTFIELRSEFTSILSSNVWIIDIV